MAKVTAPLLSFGAGGQIANTQVYANWKGRPYVRRYVVPSNPQTTAQTSTRNAFANASSIWKLMASLGVAPWNRFAEGQVLTGRNAFMSDFIKELRGKADLTDMIFSPGAKGGLIALSATPTAGVDNITIDVVPPTPPTGWTVQAAVGMAILDQDPEAITTAVTVAAEDLTDPYAVVLTGLTVAAPYRWGAWLRWLKPDGSIAYGSDISGATTPT